MPTLSDSIVSSSSRKLAVRVRPDLKARRQRFHANLAERRHRPAGKALGCQ